MFTVKVWKRKKKRRETNKSWRPRQETEPRMRASRPLHFAMPDSLVTERHKKKVGKKISVLYSSCVTQLSQSVRLPVPFSFLLGRVLQLLRQPVQTLVQTLTVGRAGCLEGESEKENRMMSQGAEYASEPTTLLLSATKRPYLDVPVAVAHLVKLQLVGNVCGVHGVGQILLVGKHQQHGIPQLVFRQHPCELVARFADTLTIVAVHHKDQTCRRLFGECEGRKERRKKEDERREMWKEQKSDTLAVSN